MGLNVNKMVFLLPFIVIILIFIAIDHLYYSDEKPKTVPPKEAQHTQKEGNTSTNYLDKYIKK